MEELFKILLVDDDSLDRMAVRRSLKSLGVQFVVEDADSGVAGLAALLREPFDCVLLDYRLSDSDGLAVLQNIRAAGIATPVVMLTGQGDEELAVELMKAGATDYLPKGRFSPEHISQSVRSAVRFYRAQLATNQAEEARHRAEDALRKSQQLLVTTLKSIGDAVIATDARACVTFMNTVAETLTGWSEPEAAGRPIAAIFHIVNEETRAEVESPVTKSIREGTVVGLANHTLLIARDGSERPIDDSAAPIRDEAGQIVGVVMTFRDVTERRQAEHALRESEERFRVMADSAPVLLWMSGTDALCNFFNQVWLTFRGRTMEQELGNGWVEGVHIDDKQRCMEIYLEAFRKQQPFEMEYRLQRTDGEYRWIVDVGTPHFAPDGTFLGYIGSCIDITSRKRAEEGLRFLAEASRILASSLDYHTSFVSMARLAVPFLADWCAVDLVDEQGAIQRAAVVANDPALEELEREIQRRYPLDTSIPYGSSTVLHSGQPQVIATISEDVLRASSHDETHLALLRARGLRSSITVPLEARERLLGALTFASAESGRHYSLDDLPLAEDLARRAAVAIDNARLYREANDAVRDRDTFLSIAAHELKTPLTSLLGYADLLRRRAERDGIASRDIRAMEVISQQGVRLNRMITSLLDLSRIQTGQLSIEREIVDLVALSRRLVDEVQHTLDRHTLELHTPDEPILIQGDELRLEQVLQNLIQNAIKYSPEGGLVNVQLERGNEHACVIVTDQGIGIPESSLPMLFSRFYRAENVALQRISGMGVGLYVVKEIVTLHNGQIEVSSREGEGSTFTVYLPLYEPHTSASSELP